MNSASRLIMGIDPGTTESAFVIWDSLKKHITEKEILPNDSVLDHIAYRWVDFDLLAVEMIESYGMPVGRETFETVVWIGRFIEAVQKTPSAYPKSFQLVHRGNSKLHHTGSKRAKDANIRQALIDKYGEPGRKASPGITYGLKSHMWQAFAVAALVAEGGELKLPVNSVNVPIEANVA